MIDNKPEKNVMLTYKNNYPRTVPGVSSYSNMTKHGKTFFVVGDSMLKPIGGKRLSEGIQCGKAFVKPFLGATVETLHEYYIQPHLKEGGIDSVVLMIGTNNISKYVAAPNGKREYVQTEDEIVEQIIKLAEDCKSRGINDIFINCIVYRQEEFY